MTETFHERLQRLGKAKDYAGVIATLRTPFPAENDADPKDGTPDAHVEGPGRNQILLSKDGEP